MINDDVIVNLFSYVRQLYNDYAKKVPLNDEQWGEIIEKIRVVEKVNNDIFCLDVSIAVVNALERADKEARGRKA